MQPFETITKSCGSVPPNVSPFTIRALPPAFVSVTVCGALSVDCGWLPAKPIGDGLACATDGAGVTTVEVIPMPQPLLDPWSLLSPL